MSRFASFLLRQRLVKKQPLAIKPTNSEYLGGDYSFEDLNLHISLLEYCNAAGYRILDISLRKGMHKTLVGGDASSSLVKATETIDAIIVLCNNANGLVSYLSLPPYYRISKKDMRSYPTTCDDIIIRFSIRRDGQGYFPPFWTTCYKGDTHYTPYQAPNNRIKYWGFRHQHISYDGYSVSKVLESQTSKLESLWRVFLQWVEDHSLRISQNDCYRIQRDNNPTY